MSQRSVNSFFMEHSGVLGQLPLRSHSVLLMRRRWQCCGQCCGRFSTAPGHSLGCAVGISSAWPARCEPTPNLRGIKLKHMTIILGMTWPTCSLSWRPKGKLCHLPTSSLPTLQAGLGAAWEWFRVVDQATLEAYPKIDGSRLTGALSLSAARGLNHPCSCRCRRFVLSHLSPSVYRPWLQRVTQRSFLARMSDLKRTSLVIFYDV